MADQRKTILSDLVSQALAFLMPHSTPEPPQQKHLSPTAPSCAWGQLYSPPGFWGTGRRGRQQCLQGLHLPCGGISCFLIAETCPSFNSALHYILTDAEAFERLSLWIKLSQNLNPSLSLFCSFSLLLPKESFLLKEKLSDYEEKENKCQTLAKKLNAATNFLWLLVIELSGKKEPRVMLGCDLRACD